MLNADDHDTVTSINLFRRMVIDKNKPLVFWLGAGVSRWAGLPTWKELARNANREFGKTCSTYDKISGKAALAEQQFADVFQLCRDADRGLYNSFLVNALRSESTSSLYPVFIEKLLKLKPTLLLTTNADTLIERHCPNLDIVERTDLSRFVSLCQQKISCVGKIHGSTSSVESLVFTTDDYSQLKLDVGYITNLQNIFATATVVFIGYGLRDEYVLRLMQGQSGVYKLFGSGPHFIITSDSQPPDAVVKPIRYSLQQHADHRGAMTVLDYIIQSHTIDFVSPEISFTPKEPEQSAFYITEFITPGTHRTSQTAKVTGNDGDPKLITIGLGWVEGEQMDHSSHALHDLLVGLICFDKTYIPLLSLDCAVGYLGEEIFETILASGSLGLLFSEEEPGVVLEHDNLVGSLTTITTVDSNDPQMMTLGTC